MNNIDDNTLPDSKRRLGEMKETINGNLSPEVLNYGALVETVRDLELESSQPNFWDDQKNAQDTLTEMNRLKDLIKRVDTWKENTEDVGTLIEMATEDEAEAGHW